MKKSAVLEREEEQERNKKSQFEQGAQSILERLGTEAVAIPQNADGSYNIQPIECCGDVVAIAPIKHSETSSGGIYMPSAGDTPSIIGVVVGWGPKASEVVFGGMSSMDALQQQPADAMLGKTVIFAPRHRLQEITGLVGHYGEAEIVLTKAINIYAFLD